MVVNLDLPKPFLSEQEVAELAGINCSEVWLYVELGAIPAPVQVGKHSCWRRFDIRRWTEGRKEM